MKREEARMWAFSHSPSPKMTKAIRPRSFPTDTFSISRSASACSGPYRMTQKTGDICISTTRDSHKGLPKGFFFFSLKTQNRCLPGHSGKEGEGKRVLSQPPPHVICCPLDQIPDHRASVGVGGGASRLRELTAWGGSRGIEAGGVSSVGLAFAIRGVLQCSHLSYFFSLCSTDKAFPTAEHHKVLSAAECFVFLPCQQYECR